MARRKTVIVRRLKEFHRTWAEYLLNANVKSLRKAALELDTYYSDNKTFMDASFIPKLLEQIETAIQDIGKTPWTVRRSRGEMRGRPATKRPRPMEVSPKTKTELNELFAERVRRIIKPGLREDAPSPSESQDDPSRTAKTAHSD